MRVSELFSFSIRVARGISDCQSETIRVFGLTIFPKSFRGHLNGASPPQCPRHPNSQLLNLPLTFSTSFPFIYLISELVEIQKLFWFPTPTPAISLIFVVFTMMDNKSIFQANMILLNMIAKIQMLL